MTADVPKDDAHKHWLVRSKTIRRLWILFIAALAVTVLFDFIVDRHGRFGLDATFGFPAWYGLLTCVAMIIGAKALGTVLQRADTYYDHD